MTARVFQVFVVTLVLASCASTTRAPEPPVSRIPAVVVLVNSADESGSKAHYDRAAEQLERALRIEPDNPRLWYELARANLSQGRSREAIQFATKSNTLTVDGELRSDNWRLIAEAYTLQGDHDQARQARTNATAE